MIQIGPSLNLWIQFDDRPTDPVHCHKCDPQGQPTRETLCGLEARGHWRFDQIGDHRCKVCERLFENFFKKGSSSGSDTSQSS